MTFRPATTADLGFCYRLYAEGLRDHVNSLFGWVEADQQRNFAATFRPDEARIVCGRIGKSPGDVAYGEVGWVQAADEADDVHLKELHVAEGSRGLGLGGWALAQVIIEGLVVGKGVRLSVLVGSPAERLYRRFGFEPVRCDPYMIHMRRPPRLRFGGGADPPVVLDCGG